MDLALLMCAGCVGVEVLIYFSPLSRQSCLQDSGAGLQASTAWHQHAAPQSLK